jgi:hypothetical protein
MIVQKPFLRGAIIPLLSLLLVLAGFLQMIGHALGIPIVSDLGFMLAVSPFPNPFRVAAGYENFAALYEFDALLHDGSVKKVKIEREEGISVDREDTSLNGPHIRRVVYFKSIALAPLYPSGIFDQILRYGVCKHGPLAQSLGIRQEVRSFTLRVWLQYPVAKDKWDRVIECAPEALEPHGRPQIRRNF